MNNKSSYSEKLLDPRWQKKRLSILERDGWCCQQCFDSSNTLHVHHRRYFKGKEPWEYDDNLLVTLCQQCHESESQEMSDVLHDLNLMLKEIFFASEIRWIAEAFSNLPIYQCPEVTSSVIKHWLCDKDRMNELGDRFFDYIHDKSKEKSSDDENNKSIQ